MDLKKEPPKSKESYKWKIDEELEIHMLALRSPTLEEILSSKDPYGQGKEITSVDARNYYSLLESCLTLNDVGKYEDAIVCFNKIINLNKQSAYAWYNKSISYGLIGNFGEVIKCSDKVIDITRGSKHLYYYAALYNKANALDALDRYEEAIDCYDLFLEGYPFLVYALYYRTRSKAKKGDVKGSLSDLKNVLKSHDWRYIYDELSKKDNVFDYMRTLKSYKLINTLIKKYDPIVWVEKGHYLRGLRDEEALEWYNKALEINPNKGDAWFGKALALKNLKNYEEALRSLDKASMLGYSQFTGIHKREVLELLGKKAVS